MKVCNMFKTLPVNRVSYRALRVWQRNFDVFLMLWKTEFWPPLIEPLFNLLAMGFGLGAYVTDINGMSYLQFIAPAFIAVTVMFTSSFECTYGSYVRMEYQKTFDAIIATPVNIEDVIAGEILYGASRSILSAIGVLFIISLFGLVSSPWALLTPFVALLGGIMLSSLAMFVTSIVPSINEFNYYFTLCLTPMFLFSDVFFPLQSLPEWIRWAGWLSPLTHVVNIERLLVLGRIEPVMIYNFLYIIIFGFVLFNIDLVLMRRRLIK
ncbi:MAG: ABC transporter permease [Candidatus Eremiobacterota bacterium]